LIEINHLDNFLVCVERLGLSRFFRELLRSVNRVVSIWHPSWRTCVTSRGKVSCIDRFQRRFS